MLVLYDWLSVNIQEWLVYYVRKESLRSSHSREILSRTWNVSDIILDSIDFQLFFLTIAKKNRTKMARVIEADKISPIGGSSKIPIVSSRDSKIN